jgi:hypothetical protein
MQKRRQQTRSAQQRRKLKHALQKDGNSGALIKKVMQLIPRNLPPQLRDDLCQELLISLIAGETTMEKLPLVIKSKATKVRKLLGETWKQRSLNDVVPGTDRITLLDTLAADHPHF